MNGLAYPTAAALAWAALIYQLVRGLRQHPRDPALYPVCTAIALLGIIFTVSTPAIWARIDSVVATPNLSLLISQSSVIVFSGTMQCLIISWIYPHPAKHARWRVLWVLAVLIAMAVLFFRAEQRDERPTDAAATYANDPAYAAYLGCYIAMFALGNIDIIRLCLPYARNAGRTWLSRGLRLTAIGAVFGLLYCAVRATTLIEAQLGTDPHPLEALVPLTASIGAALVIIGLALPSLGPRRLSPIATWHTRRRAYRRLYPLWEAIAVTITEVVLDRSAEPTRRVFRDVDRHLGRRAIEIGDGIRQLRHHMNDAVAAAAKASAEREGLTGQQRDAVAYAAQLLTACITFEPDRRQRFDPPADHTVIGDEQRRAEAHRRERWDRWRGSLPTTNRRLAPAAADSGYRNEFGLDHEDFTAEVHWLAEVSQALHTSWIVAAATNDVAGTQETASR
jgi:hypothetical protein